MKSIEPELQSMTIRHQQEICDLRALHKKELEDLELKAARRTQQQLEALREQLAEERDKTIAHEKELMQQRYLLFYIFLKARQTTIACLLQQQMIVLSNCIVIFNGTA